MSMNKDLVAEAVAAIPLWMAFLDQKEAEQDALIEQMQQGPKRTSYADRATSFLKKKKEEKEQPLNTTSEPAPPSTLNLSKPSSIDQEKPSQHDDQDDAQRWAPLEVEESEEESVEESIESDMKNMFH